MAKATKTADLRAAGLLKVCYCRHAVTAGETKTFTKYQDMLTENQIQLGQDGIPRGRHLWTDLDLDVHPQPHPR